MSDNPFAEAEKIKPKRGGLGSPSPGILVVAAAWVGSVWQSLNDALPDYRAVVALGAILLLFGLIRWARSE